jgi:hypothetical protein
MWILQGIDGNGKSDQSFDVFKESSKLFSFYAHTFSNNILCRIMYAFINVISLIEWYSIVSILSVVGYVAKMQPASSYGRRPRSRNNSLEMDGRTWHPQIGTVGVLGAEIFSRKGHLIVVICCLTSIYYSVHFCYYFCVTI